MLSVHVELVGTLWVVGAGVKLALAVTAERLCYAIVVLAFSRGAEKVGFRPCCITCMERVGKKSKDCQC